MQSSLKIAKHFDRKDICALYIYTYFEGQPPCSKALLNECLKSSLDYIIRVIGN